MRLTEAVHSVLRVPTHQLSESLATYSVPLLQLASSAMAEAIGIVASSVTIGTLATGITSSISKLRSVWDQIQDAPDDIRDLLEELEDLGCIIADIEEDQQRHPMSSMILDPTSSTRCLERCRQGADRLKDLADDLSTNMGSSNRLNFRRASAKVVLKKAQLERFRTRLERAVRLLSLSHQLYTRYVLFCLFVR